MRYAIGKVDTEDAEDVKKSVEAVEVEVTQLL